METMTSLFKVLWAPKETLSFVAKNPRVIAPLLLITLFTVAEAVTLFAMVDPGQLMIQQWQGEGIADKISPEDQIELVTTARELQRVALVSESVAPIVITFVAALIFFGCFSLLGRIESGFKTFLSLTAFSFIPLIFTALAKIVTFIAFPVTPTTLDLAGRIGPVLFLDPHSVSRVIYVGAVLIDLVSLWILALLVIGYGFVASPRVTTTHRVMVVFGVWLVYAVLRLGLAGVANV